MKLRTGPTAKCARRSTSLRAISGSCFIAPASSCAMNWRSGEVRSYLIYESKSCMLKISPTVNGHRKRILQLEGQVTGPWVAEARAVCETILERGEPLQLDMAEVSFVDHSGLGFLRDLESRGVSLINCSPFVAAQLKLVP